MCRCGFFHAMGSNCACHTTAFIAHCSVVLQEQSMSALPCAIAVFQEEGQHKDFIV